MAISDDMTKHDCTPLHSSFTRSKSDINPSKCITLDKGVKTAMQRLAEGITTSQDTSAHGLPWLRCFVQSSGQANVLGEGIVEFGSFLHWGGGMVAAGTSGAVHVNLIVVLVLLTPAPTPLLNFVLVRVAVNGEGCFYLVHAIVFGTCVTGNPPHQKSMNPSRILKKSECSSVIV